MWEKGSHGNWGDNKEMKKFVLYTAIFGKMGRFNVPNVSIPDVDRFCLTDLNVKSKFYQVKNMDLNHLISVRRQRFVKICIPDEIFDNHEYSVYVDCKRPYSVDFDYLLSCMEEGSDIVTRQHRRRSCAYDEGEFCIIKKKDHKATILKQLEYYKSQDYPAHNGLHASGLLLRRHTEKMKWFSEFWWQQIEKYSHRDQISLPYVGWKHGMKISICGRRK